MLRHHSNLCLLAVVVVLGLTTNTLAEGTEERGHHNSVFTTIDVPGALSTVAADISPTGDIVGRYCLDPSCIQDITGNWHGYLLSGGEFTSIDFPGAFHTNATGINARGDIVGRYRDVVGGPFRGFLLSEGEFTRIDFPGAVTTRAYGITPGGETIVGDYCTTPGCLRPATGDWHGFVLRGGEFTSFDFPGAVFTQVWRINPKGEIIGRYKGTDGASHMFLLSDGSFTSIDFPGASNTGSDAGGINPRGDIVGGYCDTPGCAVASTGGHGFLLSRGEFTSFDFPGAVVTNAFGINPRGDILGTYIDTGGDFHGFLRSREERDDGEE